MTEEQRLQIKVMRYQRIGYMKITEATGLLRDSVRFYCKRNGLDGFGKDLKVKIDEKFISEVSYQYCLSCGLKLEHPKRGAKKKYCSLACKRDWERDNPKLYKLHCDYCRKEYISERVKKRKFCSNDCYVRDRFFREEDSIEIFGKITKRKKVDYIPKWLEDLLLSYIKN